MTQPAPDFEARQLADELVEKWNDRNHQDLVLNIPDQVRLELMIEQALRQAYQAGLLEAAKIVENYSDFKLSTDRAICVLRHPVGCNCTPGEREQLASAIRAASLGGSENG